MSKKINIINTIKPFNKTIKIEGDKSLSIRWALLASQAKGKSRSTNLLNSEDVLSTLKCLKKLGIKIKLQKNVCEIKGLGLNGFKYKKNIKLNAGNSGTLARLIMGLSSSHPITTLYTGDSSLSMRPMQRVLKPLINFGSSFSLRKDEFLPAILKGSVSPIPFIFDLNEPSAQIKSAVLLGALNTPGTTIIRDKFIFYIRYN